MYDMNQMGKRLRLVFLLHQPSIFRSSKALLPHETIRSCLLFEKVADVDHIMHYWGNKQKKCLVKHAVLKNGNYCFRCQLMAFSKQSPTFHKSRRMGCLFPFASTDDGVAVNGSPQARTSGDVQDIRIKLNQSLQNDDSSDGFVQSLHDAARIFELAIREQSKLSKMPWFSTAWLGVDRNAWVKTLAYQASVHSLLQAAMEITCRGDGRDRDINAFVQRSLLRLSSPLEIVIRDKLSAKQPEAYDWFWSEQFPAVVTTFVNYFETNSCFTAATAVGSKELSLSSSSASDISLLMLALNCTTAVTKLGPTKVSCSQFFSMIPEITGRLMDMLVDFVPVRQVYLSLKNMGLRREFLVHFGPKAAACRVKNDRGVEEVAFWVELVQKQLQQAIHREKIWSRLTTCESIEVLERDLAIFGLFIALGRSSRSFLAAKGFDVTDDLIEGLIRYLVGGSVLYYAQLSSVSSYQLYVEVVCEELDWLPFYPGNTASIKQSQSHKSRKENPPNPEAISQVLDACSHWMQSFIKYSKWLEDPSNVKAARFLSKGHVMLMDCMKELGMLNRNKKMDNDTRSLVVNAASGSYPAEREPVCFDKALESVEQALIRLEGLLQELHQSSSKSGKEHLKAACSDLERIRKLKKQAEFLEASFRAKAASLQQEDNSSGYESSISEQHQFLQEDRRKDANIMHDGGNSPLGFWSLLARFSTKKSDCGSSTLGGTKDEPLELTTAKTGTDDSEQAEIFRFENLRKELIELEERVQKSADQSEHEEDIKPASDVAIYWDGTVGPRLFQVQQKENVIAKSFGKLKEVSADVFQGTQLLAIDVVTAMGLLRRVIIGDELTEKEKQVLRRTLSDLASVVPIGVLMLLPVTAVGHAAMLAAIQRYVPAMIPSAYAAERLDLLRQLEKVKELETSKGNPDEDVEELV